VAICIYAVVFKYWKNSRLSINQNGFTNESKLRRGLNKWLFVFMQLFLNIGKIVAYPLTKMGSLARAS
jgi:hypothetical protein